MTDPRTRRALAAGLLTEATGAGTGWLLAGSIVGGLAAYAFQIVGTRSLGEAAYAPIGTLWTIQYLVWSVLLFAAETFVIREMHLVGGSLSRGAVVRIAGWIAAAAGGVTVACWLIRDRLFFGLGDLAIVAGAIVLSFGALAVVRGSLAGSGRYRTYGVVSATESVARLAIAVAISVAGAGARALAWALPLGAATASAWFMFRGSGASARTAALPLDDARPADRSRMGRFLLTTATANGATQLLLAGGPLALVALSASPGELSVFFVTLTAARVPIVLALGGLLSRLLPAFDRILEQRGRADLPRIVELVAAATVLAAMIAAAAAAAVGEPLVGVLFGASLAPPGWLAAVAVAGTVLATGGMVVNQALIAAGLERWSPAPWLVGLSVGIVCIAVLGGTPMWRVGISFVVGESAALMGLVVVARLAVRAEREG